MKAFNRTLFTVFILLPCLILGYQNCSDLSSKDLEVNPDGSLVSNSLAPKEKPVFINDLSLLDYSQPSDCSADQIDTLKLYSSKTNICTEASDSCEAFYLIKNGYLEDQSKNCDDVAHPSDDDFQRSLKTTDAASMHFKSKPDQICTMQFSKMISFKSRECASAADGCQISFYTSNGFVKDSFSVCK